MPTKKKSPKPKPKSMPNTKPSVVGTPENIRIRHKEYIGPITPSSNLTYSTTAISFLTPGYDIVPTNNVLFPWLSRVAAGFEMYQINALRIKVVSYQPSTATGAFYISADPDWQDDVPTTKVFMLGLATSVSKPVWESFDFTIPAKRFQGSMPWKYLSISATRSPGEPRTSNYGFISFGTDCADSYRWDVFVEYDIQLRQPTVEGNYVSDKSATITATLTTDSTGVVYPAVSTAMGTTPNLVGIDLGSDVTANQSRRVVVPITQLAKDIVSDLHLTNPGASPSDLITFGVRPGARIYDNAAQLLVTLAGDGSGFASTTGVNDPSKLSTSGETLHMTLNTVLSAIKAAYPSAAYYIPYIAGLAAATGYSTSATTYVT